MFQNNNSNSRISSARHATAGRCAQKCCHCPYCRAQAVAATAVADAAASPPPPTPPPSLQSPARKPNSLPAHRITRARHARSPPADTTRTQRSEAGSEVVPLRCRCRRRNSGLRPTSARKHTRTRRHKHKAGGATGLDTAAATVVVAAAGTAKANMCRLFRYPWKHAHMHTPAYTLHIDASRPNFSNKYGKIRSRRGEKLN